LAKVLYKPFGIVAGLLAGLVASKLFDKIWGLISDEEPPDPEDRDADWAGVIASAAVSGVIYKVVQTLVRRSGAKSFERATGIWPGNTEPRA
jgi:hypothetical protein